MTTLYKGNTVTGMLFTQKGAYGIDIPNYVYDLWGNILDGNAFKLLGVYRRLARDGFVKGMSLEKIARSQRMSKTTVIEKNNQLVECGFIEIEKPEGHFRLMHWTLKICTLEPPRFVSPEIMQKYCKDGDPSNYEILTDWLWDREVPTMCNAEAVEVEETTPAVLYSTADSPDQYRDAVPDSTAKIDPLYIDPSITPSTQTKGPKVLVAPYQHDPRGARGDGKEYRVSDELDTGKSPYTALELYILQETGQKQLAESRRALLDETVLWVGKKNPIGQTAPSPNELYDTDPRYRSFVWEKITPLLKNEAKRRRFNSEGFARTLHGQGTMRWFFEDYAPTATTSRNSHALTEEEIRRIQNELPGIPD